MSKELTLNDLIKRYYAAEGAWKAVCIEKDCDMGEKEKWAAYEAAEDAVLDFPCLTLEDILLKVRFILSNENAQDSLQNCTRSINDKRVHCLLPFLHSLLGESIEEGAN